jgi:excisionase family DNA binding protein
MRRKATPLDPSLKRVFSIEEFCAYYGPCWSKVYDAIKRGELKSRMICGRRRILREDAEAFIKAAP